MYGQAIAGYPTNTWNTAYPYSNMNFQNNVTNIYNGGNNISIFGNTQQISYNTIYAQQQQTPDYTGKVLDMMMAMNMMLFQKKLNEGNNQTTEKPKVVIEDAANNTAKTTNSPKVVIEDTGRNNIYKYERAYKPINYYRPSKPTLDDECPGEITKEDAKNAGIAAILDVAGVTGGLALPFVGLKKIGSALKKLFK
jgi:hypothetical protein